MGLILKAPKEKKKDLMSRLKNLLKLVILMRIMARHKQILD